MTTRKTYTAEFKRQAIELADREDIGPSRVARDLGISLSALSRWRKQAAKQGSLAFPGQGRMALTPQEQEIFSRWNEPTGPDQAARHFASVSP